MLSDDCRPEFANWAEGHPNCSLGWCISVDETGTLRSTNCSESLYSVCNNSIISTSQHAANEAITPSRPSAFRFNVTLLLQFQFTRFPKENNQYLLPIFAGSASNKHRTESQSIIYHMLIECIGTLLKHFIAIKQV